VNKVKEAISDSHHRDITCWSLKEADGKFYVIQKPSGRRNETDPIAADAILKGITLGRYRGFQSRDTLHEGAVGLAVIGAVGIGVHWAL
jgi:hypothetical protein